MVCVCYLLLKEANIHINFICFDHNFDHNFDHSHINAVTFRLSARKKFKEGGTQYLIVFKTMNYCFIVLSIFLKGMSGVPPYSALSL